MIKIIPASIITIFIFITGCTAVNESPTRYGWNVTTMPGVQIGSTNSSVHAVLSYARVNYKGGGGHNRFLQFGPQYRYSPKGDKGIWFGAEATYMNVASVSDFGMGDNPTGSAFTIGPAAGYRINIGKLPLNFYLAPAYLRRGTLKVDDMDVVPASSGYYGRLGVDIPFMTWLSDKGR
jgi:hypothetical protein